MSIVFTYPRKPLQMNSLTLALLLNGRKLNPKVMIKEVGATRLALYIHDLNKKGLRGFIDSKPLPLTIYQRTVGSTTPFHEYSIKAECLSRLSNEQIAWSDDVLNCFWSEMGLNIDAFEKQAERESLQTPRFAECSNVIPEQTHDNSVSGVMQ